MVYLSPEKAFDKLFMDLGKYVENTAAVIATSYAKEGTRAVAEAWADELIAFFTLGLLVPDLSPETISNREKRGVNVGAADAPLYETGTLLTSIEFIHTHIPSRNYDILEVGVFDDYMVVGHSDSITVKDLAMIHEYGNETTPARPFMDLTAMMVGHDITRRVSSVANKIRAAFDREKRTADPNSVVGAASIVSRKRKVGPGAPTVVARGKIVKDSQGYRLEWTGSDAE